MHIWFKNNNNKIKYFELMPTRLTIFSLKKGFVLNLEFLQLVAKNSCNKKQFLQKSPIFNHSPLPQKLYIAQKFKTTTLTKHEKKI